MTFPETGGDASQPVSRHPRSLRAQAVRSFGWAVLSFGSSRLVIFVMTLVLTRLLVPEDFGVVAAGLTLVTFLELALDLGIGAAVVYEQEEGVSPRVRVAYTLNLAVATALALLGLLLAPTLAGLLQVPESVAVFRALFLYLVLRGAGQIQAAVLQRDLRFKERTAIEVSSAVTRAVTSVALAMEGAGAWAIVGGLLVGEALALVLYVWRVRLLPTLRLEYGTAMALLRFGASVVGIKIASSVLTSADKLIVGSRLGPESLGYYVIAFRLPELAIGTMGWIFSSVALATYARTRKTSPEFFRDGMLTAMRLVTLFGFTAGVGLAVAAPIAVPVLFSDVWTPAIPVTIVVALAFAVSTVGYSYGDIFTALGRPGLSLRLLVWLVPLAVLGYWLAAPLGMALVASVLLAFDLLYTVLRLRLANRLVGTSWGEILRALRPGAVSSAGVLLGALPVALLLDPSPAALAGCLVSGTVGAAALLLLFERPTLTVVLALARAGFRS